MRIKKEERIKKSVRKISELIERKIVEIKKKCNDECSNDKEKHIMARTKLKKYLKELYADENTIVQITHRKIYLTKESKDIQGTMLGIFGALILSYVINFSLMFNKIIYEAMGSAKGTNSAVIAIVSNLIFVSPFVVFWIIILFLAFAFFRKIKKDMYSPPLYEKLDIEKYELKLIEESYKKVYGECD